MVTAMPRWDLTTFFPQLDSPEFREACSNIDRKLSSLETLFDSNGIGLGAVSEGTDPLVDSAITGFNEAGALIRVVKTYVGGLVDTDSDDQAAQAADSETDSLSVRFSKLGTRLFAWLGTLTGDLSDLAKEHAFVIEKAKIVAKHQMSPAEESLAADLSTSGWIAWMKLHGNVGSQLMVEVDLPDGKQTIPMSAVRNLAFDPSDDVRRAAYEAELAAWKSIDMTMAACLNGVKGDVTTLCRRRGWESPLEESLFENSIDQETLDAMLGAAEEFFPVFRKYLQAKAKTLGKKSLPFYDIFAPVGEERSAWTVEQAEAFVEKSFRSYSDKLADFSVRAFRERWIDYEARKGKRDGAYCAGYQDDVSRILMNFKPSYKSVATLAHELGHGYHNLCLKDRAYLQHDTPSTLAETASIFCETIMKNAALAQGSDEDNLAILEAVIGGACQVVVDISSRFKFEKGVFDGRVKRELSAKEMCDLMVQAQKDTYGDGLDESLLHPYMWAVKPHYYFNGSYYNFPYMFGLLFGLGLYAIYQKQPQGFHARYDDLLSSTGLADAATLAARFGIDTRTKDFWRGSLSVIEADINRFVEIVEA